MKNIYLLLFALLANLQILSAQKTVDYNFISTVTKAEFMNTFGLEAKYDVDMYKLRYKTNDITGALDTASGLLLVPVGATLVFPLHCSQHGTVGSREDVPSNLQGGYQLALIVAANGFVTAAADFLGLGDARGLHPYIHADTEASAAIDMLFATRELQEQLDFNLNDQLYLSGYSQGGHAAMAAHREIQQNYANDFTVTAASHMSGPYSVSQEMTNFTLSEQEYFFVAYIPHVANSMKMAYPELLADFELEDMFKAEYLVEINKFFAEEVDLFTLNQTLIDMLVANEGASIPNRILKDGVADMILNDPSNPLSQALALNDVYDWAPDAPTRLLYCKGDDQVTYTNSILAEEVMKENGAANLFAVNLGDNNDHGQCVNPAIGITLIFFDIYQSITSSTTDVSFDEGDWVYPNPADNTINIKDVTDAVTLIIYDLNGHIIRQQKATSTVDVSDMASGMYYIRLSSNSKEKIQKLIKL